MRGGQKNDFVKCSHELFRGSDLSMIWWLSDGWFWWFLMKCNIRWWINDDFGVDRKDV